MGYGHPVKSFIMFNNRQTLDVRGTQLAEAKHKGARYVITITVGDEQEQYQALSHNLTENGFIIFETLCGKYIKHTGDYTVYEISRNAK